MGADVNGDGYTDLPVDGYVGDPGDSEPYAGVLLGGEDGLTPERSVVLTRSDLGLADDVETLTVLDTGDLDGDGYTDLLVDAGSGFVVWGGPEGPAGEAVPLPWLEKDEPFDMYAVSLAVGDLDGDGHSDVAVLDHLQGTPVDEFEAAYHQGPFDRDGSPTESSAMELPDDADDADLAVFDADGDAALDLLLVRNYDESPAPHLVLRSGPDGPAQEVLGDTAPGHAYGTGDFDADGSTDLLIGVSGIPNNEPGHDDELHPGYVDVYGGDDGFLAAEPVRLTRASEGVPGEAEDGDGFGNGLLVGDVNGDGHDDAAVMAGPFHSFESVTVLFGGPEGLTGEGSASVPVPERGDLGSYSHHSLADYNGDGYADLLLSTVSSGFPPNAGAGYALHLGGPEGVDPEPLEFTTEEL
ncbi:FG-GAP repeat domain-containing protein [Nocardiopsis ganjiahuensis]|uniref:FG-GAP repeat domain-containing protein n=1 Tax=Nocardiopsis ganjiahuensis TaxID=239984 RepID=UPI00034C7C08|nr:VCBS repeat-containing protein [Nocardiopsis ganjiahuensis]